MSGKQKEEYVGMEKKPAAERDEWKDFQISRIEKGYKKQEFPYLFRLWDEL